MKFSFMMFFIALTSVAQAEQKYTSLADTFDQCDASQFNIKIDWGNKFQPPFHSLPDCIQVKPIREFRLRPSYKDMPFLKIPKNGNTDDYSLGDYYRFADDAFRSAYMTTDLLGSTSFSLPNEGGLGARYGASPAFQICQYIWYKLDDLAGQKGTAFDPSGKTHNFMVMLPSACQWGFEGVELRDSPVHPSPIMHNYPASPFWIIQFDKGGSKEEQEIEESDKSVRWKYREPNPYSRIVDKAVSKNAKRYHHFSSWLLDIRQSETNPIGESVRILYHDDAQFIKILHPKGAKENDYPVLVYGGLTSNGIPFNRVAPSSSPVTKNIHIIGGEMIQGIFMSRFDKKEKRFVEAGTLMDLNY